MRLAIKKIDGQSVTPTPSPRRRFGKAAPFRSSFFNAFAGIISALVVTLLILAIFVARQLEELRIAPVDNTLWTFSHVTTEFYRLDAAYYSYLYHQGNKEAGTNLKQRFEIFYSRTNILRDSSDITSFSKHQFFREGLGELKIFLEKLAPVIQHSSEGSQPGDQIYVKEFERIGPMLSQFVAAAVQVTAIDSDTKRLNLRNLLFFGIAVAFFLFLSFIVSLVVLIRQGNELHKREREVIESRDTLQATIKSSLDGIIIMDSGGNVIDINESAREIFALTADALVGQNVRDLLAPSQHGAPHWAELERYLSASDGQRIGQRIEIEAVKGNGEEIIVELSMSMAQAASQPIFVAFVRDISNRHRDEEALRHAKDRAEEASKAKAQFLAAMSHEIRTPLTGILGALDILKTTSMSDQQRKYIDSASRSGEALLSVISDVIDMSRLDAGKAELFLADFTLSDLIGDVMEIVKSLAQRRQNTIELHIDEAIPGRLIGDSSKLRQVLLNLMSNAVKFTHRGKISLAAKILERRTNVANIEISVADTGIGIAAEDQSRLFQEFSQVDMSYTRPVGGSGLGLSISKKIIELMGGRIGVESAPGKGSRFWIRLPFEIANGKDWAQKMVGATYADHRRKEPKNLLIVDDNETIRTVIGDMLRAQGHKTTLADSGMAAIDILSKSNFDAVLMDISMPGIDGMEAARRIRALPGPSRNVPIVALTAHALSEDRERSFAAGINHFLTKPIRLPALLSIIDGLNPEEHVEATLPLMKAEDHSPPLFDKAEWETLSHSLNNKSLLNVLNRFAEELDRHLQRLKGAPDSAEMQHILHTLAGSAATIGAKKLALFSKDLDQAAKAGTVEYSDNIRTKLIDLIKESRSAVDIIRGEMKQTKEESGRPRDRENA